MKNSELASISDIQFRHVDTYESNPDRIEADAGTERQDRADYEGRFVFELLQNAVDEMGSIDEPQVRFELTEDRLLVANNGTVFSYNDLYALTLTTRTTKAGETTIGHKGRGFTSVLGVTDNPRVFSDEVQAQFSREMTAELLNNNDHLSAEQDDDLAADKVPLLCIPHETTTPSRVRELLNDGFTTVFELPLREPARHRESIHTKLNGLDANTVALLPELKKIKISCLEQDWEWKISRHDMAGCDATLIRLTTDTADVLEETRTDWFCLFERTDLNQEQISERADLTRPEVEAMGELSVGIAFTATPIGTPPSLRPKDWKLTPVYGDTNDQPPYLHVFLPTKERSPIPALVTGTFQSDTSRRNLTLNYDDAREYDGQFNALLFTAVGQLLADRVIPFFEQSATSAAGLLDTLDPSLGQRRDWSFTQGTVEDCLFEAIRTGLTSVEFLPSARSDRRVAIDDITLPPTSAQLSDLGADFVSLLQSGDRQINDQSRVPAAELSTHQHAQTLVAYGASQYDAPSIPEALDAVSVDPSLRVVDEREFGRTPPDDDESCHLTIDPVLEYLVRLRKTLESDEDRSAFDEACRQHAVFPIEIITDQDGMKYARRGSNETGTIFMPPEGDITTDALPTLEFLPRELYHGTNADRAAPLREDVLPANFDADVQAIWDINDYLFSQVFDTAISPHLPGPNSPNADSSILASDDVLRTIREMTDVQSPENERSPESPLLYQSAKKPFSALAQLPVPTQTTDGDVEWNPAHRVYFNSTWQSALGRPEDAHIEPFLDAVAAQTDSERFDPKFLASPAWFTPDEDEPHSKTLEAWAAFFSWLGVSEHIRPLPLFAPGERQSYRQTQGLNRPPKSTITASDDLRSDGAKSADNRYTGLTEAEWQAYRDHLVGAVTPEIPDPDEQYLFQVNSLEYASETLSAAKQSDAVGSRLLTHLMHWWDHGLSARRHATVAEFTNERWRGSNVSYVFNPDEQRSLGWNLWVWQIRQARWVPTAFDAVRPTAAWSLPRRDRDRFSLEVNGMQPLLPFVHGDFPTRKTETTINFEELTDTLGIGVRLEQDTFSPQDAERVISRIGELLDWTDNDLAQYSSAVELLYTRVAELLPRLKRGDPITGDWAPEQSELADALVLCRVDDEYALRRASDTYFIRSRSSRDRYGSLGLPLLAMFKPEAVSLGEYCGATDLRTAVEEQPGYGDERPLPTAISGFEIDAKWLQTVLAALVLRLRTSRPSSALVDQDTARTQSFLENIVFVTDLDLNISLTDGSWNRNLDPKPQPYHIERDGDTIETILIDATLDREEFVEALTGAYTDRLDVPQYYEAVNNLVDHAFGNPTPAIALRERLRTVGSEVPTGQVEATRVTLFEGTEASPTGEADVGHPPEPEIDHNGAFNPDRSTHADPSNGESIASTGTGGTSAHSSRVPSIETVTRIGDRRIAESFRNADVSIDQANNGSRQPSGNRRSTSGSHSGGGPASQEYRDKIDAFGMAVTLDAERIRLTDENESDPESKVFDVHTPEEYEKHRETSKLLEQAIHRFAETRGLSATENPLDRNWPGFDILTIRTDDSGSPIIDRCIELKTSGRNTQKPSLSWNEWKAAGGPLSEHYYLYVARNIRLGNSGDAELLEIPQPFDRLRNRRRDTRERNVQVDLRSFDFSEDPIVERPIEWEE
ncbi:sacsin N-terminal ATP-binding-like domain-containing protein [Salinigranum marinum]|uniref:sacsin N-terminal ATP-binding-like domain-containing protein n=1 Tax=Salinigranum marinum TaxID=1515595 RepID=UPI002989F29A|nr:ATP-binding protein [Salinigranum marinum]